MPMPDRRALPATAGSTNHVDRSGVAVIAALRKPLHNMDLAPVYRICSFQGTQVLPIPYAYELNRSMMLFMRARSLPAIFALSFSRKSSSAGV